jgi:hypothetical protein
LDNSALCEYDLRYNPAEGECSLWRKNIAKIRDLLNQRHPRSKHVTLSLPKGVPLKKEK